MFTNLVKSVRRLWGWMRRYSLPLVSGLSLLLFALSTTLHFKQKGALVEFVVGLVTIVPIASLIRFATRDIVLKLEEAEYELSSGLLNGILGNGAELCFTLAAVARKETLLARTALTGALISNCLVIFGSCQLFGGIRHHRHPYPVILARNNAQLLVLNLVSITLPTAFNSWSQDSESSLLTISKGVAVVLLLQFASYIGFFYVKHTDTENDLPSNEGAVLIASGTAAVLPDHLITRDFRHRFDKFRTLKALRTVAREAQKEEDAPRHPWYLSLLTLVCSLTAMVFTSVYVLEAVDAPSQSVNLSKSFVGLVIMPSAIASVDHIMAVLRSRKESIGWIIEVALGSSIRIFLLVFPLAVLFGWIIGAPMDMTLDGFQVTILGLTIILVHHVIHNGYGHWLEGTIFLSSFLLFAIAIWHYPNDA